MRPTALIAERVLGDLERAIDTLEETADELSGDCPWGIEWTIELLAAVRKDVVELT